MPARPDRDPLAMLPGVVAQLHHAIRNPATAGGNGAFGARLPIGISAHDLLYNPDHRGHPGIVPGLASLEIVTRLALGDSLPDPLTEPANVERACGYIAAQASRLCDQATWSDAATGEVETMLDLLLSRIDVSRVRLDWEIATKRASERLRAVLDTPVESVEHLDRLCDQAEALAATMACTYVDYEGRLMDAITSRYLSACEPLAWAGLVWAETSHMLTSALSLLGLAEHSTAPLASCPFCNRGWIGLLRDDPGRAGCDHCGQQRSVEDWEALYRAFAQAGIAPVATGWVAPFTDKEGRSRVRLSNQHAVGDVA